MYGIVTGIFDLSEVKNMELSRLYSTCQKYRTWIYHGYIRLVWGKEHGIVTGIFDLSEVRNMELSRVFSICQKLRTYVELS
jgi:hypothetical protein